MSLENLVGDFAKQEPVEAIALGGSRATGKDDEKSDYDVYVYLNAPLAPEIRREILAAYCGVMEIENHFWEQEDNCTLKNGVDLDIIYRDPASFERDLHDVVFQHQPRNGYTTCMWHNLLTCKILFDRNGALAEMQKKYTVPYPAPLKQNIIVNNRRLLSGSLPSYDRQIKKAFLRGDLVAVNHRVTEFLASYFDILLAMNGLTHPGEKRLIPYCRQNCRMLPQRWEANLSLLSERMFQEDTEPLVAEMVRDLDACLAGKTPETEN